MQCLEIKCMNPESQQIRKVASAAQPTNMQDGFKWAMIQVK
jgi:hypothetical protein